MLLPVPAGSVSPQDVWKVPGSSHSTAYPTPCLTSVSEATCRSHTCGHRTRHGSQPVCPEPHCIMGHELWAGRSCLPATSPQVLAEQACLFSTRQPYRQWDMTHVLLNLPCARADTAGSLRCQNTDTAGCSPTRDTAGASRLPVPLRVHVTTSTPFPPGLHSLASSLFPSHSWEMSLLLNPEDLVPQPLTIWIVTGWQLLPRSPRRSEGVHSPWWYPGWLSGVTEEVLVNSFLPKR